MNYDKFKQEAAVIAERLERYEQRYVEVVNALAKLIVAVDRHEVDLSVCQIWTAADEARKVLTPRMGV